MVIDLNQAVNIGNYFSHLHLNPVKNITDTLLGKYKETVILPQEIRSVKFLHTSGNQRYDRDLY